MNLTAWPQNDRLGRWRLVDLSSPGIGKDIIAENIRSERVARRLCELVNSDDEWADKTRYIPK